MSTVPQTPRPGRRHDPFRLGYRPVGSGQVPLTLDDVAHPRPGDVIMESDAHAWDLAYLFTTLRTELQGDPQALVLCDTGVYWDRPGIRNHSPDITVVRGVREQRPIWRSYKPAETGVIPSLFIEVTSLNARQSDLRIKRSEYYRLGVPTYVIADDLPRRPTRELRLIALCAGPRGYQEQRLDAHGRFWMEAVGLFIGVEGPRVACYDRRGRRIPDAVELAAEAAAVRRRAAAAEREVEEANRRIRELEEELRRLRERG